jgi:hypothetical protein
VNPEVKAKWVAALRSGKYRQGDQHVLNDGKGGFCCLGVLCDLYAKEAEVGWELLSYSGGMRLQLAYGSMYYPPDTVREWAGFHEDQATVNIGGTVALLAIHNDGVNVPRRTFAEIADAIEAQL